MIIKRIAVLIALIGIIILLPAINYAQTKRTQEATKGFKIWDLFFPKETSVQILTNILVEDFENCDAWTALMPLNQGFARTRKVAAAPKKVKEEYPDRAKYVLGVKVWAYSRGFNWVEIKPPQPLRITQKLKALSIWVAGRNYRHSLEIWVRNYKGGEYPVYMGRLHFRGWRRLTAKLPKNVMATYYEKYVPQYKPMEITKIVLRYDPNERAGIYYLYLDNIEAVVDTYEEPYDGDDLINKEGEERWEEVIRPEQLQQKQQTKGGK